MVTPSLVFHRLYVVHYRGYGYSVQLSRDFGGNNPAATGDQCCSESSFCFLGLFSTGNSEKVKKGPFLDPLRLIGWFIG